MLIYSKYRKQTILSNEGPRGFSEYLGAAALVTALTLLMFI
jgi:hypothetical protein